MPPALVALLNVAEYICSQGHSGIAEAAGECDIVERHRVERQRLIERDRDMAATINSEVLHLAVSTDEQCTSIIDDAAGDAGTVERHGVFYDQSCSGIAETASEGDIVASVTVSNVSV